MLQAWSGWRPSSGRLSELPDRSPAADEPVVSKLRSATEEEVDGWVASDDHGSVNGVVGGIKTHCGVSVEVNLFSLDSTTGPERK
jgi:hypothetical protein